jgi:asparagine synthase (glutamine-hydrolysing)
MEQVARMPSSLKLRGRTGKYIFKKAFEPILPKQIIYRTKQGFAVPLAGWFRKELREMARDAILGESDGLLDQKFLNQVWNEHQGGRFNRSAYLWAVLMYRRWKQKFTD